MRVTWVSHRAWLPLHTYISPPRPVTVRYTRSRVPRSREDFALLITSDVPISPFGQLCFDIQMPTPLQPSEYGVFLFEARDPVGGKVMKYYVSTANEM